jgi:hypothetical protein
LHQHLVRFLSNSHYNILDKKTADYIEIVRGRRKT